MEERLEEEQELPVEKINEEAGRKYIVKIRSIMADTKEERQKFVENVQKWVSIDTQIKATNEKVKKARELKSQLIGNIYQYVEKNALVNTRIEISDGDLKFYEKRDYQPITFGYVEDCLEKLISDPKEVERIMDYLHDNREVKVTKDIRRNYTKVQDKSNK
jgi:hypothetical protein